MWERLLDRFIGHLIRNGTLIVQMPDGATHRYGDGTGAAVTIYLNDSELPRKIVMNPALGVGEGYTDGTLLIKDDDLYGFLSVVIRNSARSETLWWRWPADMLRRALRPLHMFNPIGRAQKNVAHHYDLSGQLYDLFLDQDKQYSCAYFRTPDDTLEQAQIQKKAHIARKLKIGPNMRVLDIGCGWGGMAMTLARDYGASVLGVTLSEEQHKIATERVRAAGLQDRVEIRLADYRNVTGRFDRIVSIGMFEHVGVPHFRQYFHHVHDMLTDDGIALIHTIGRASPPGTTNAWIEKYIFPGGYVPAISETMRAVEKEHLWATDIEIWRLHYAQTLKHWHDRFMAHIDEARALYDEKFCRMWRFYLVACELTFRLDYQVVFQFQLTRSLEAAPLTRDYIYAGQDKEEDRRSHAAE